MVKQKRNNSRAFASLSWHFADVKSILVKVVNKFFLEVIGLEWL
jgi:hypothetical protein